MPKSKFIHALEILAKRGDVECQHELGLIYLNGDRGEPKDPEAAKVWFNMAVEQKNADSMLCLGKMLHREGDIEGAVRLLEMAAEKSNCDAQFALGLIYDNEFGADAAGKSYVMKSQVKARENIKADEMKAKAIEWYKRAADGGSAEAFGNLGNLYMGADGIKRDDALAAHYLKKAIELGCKTAYFNLAMLHLTSDTATPDQKAYAVYLLCVAAQGDAGAMLSLAIRFGSGEGLPQSGIVAEELLGLAASAGCEPAVAAAEQMGVDFANMRYGIVAKRVPDWDS